MNKVTAVLGFTGAFGSGCTTGAKHLRDKKGFDYLGLSDLIRDEWRDRRGMEKKSERGDLQRLGDELRQVHGPGVLAMRAANLIHERAELGASVFVVDGIRNVGEIEEFRQQFGYRFYLIAVLSSGEARWERIGSTAYIDHGLSQRDFLMDDARDRNEETATGQQVELCIDQADILINNSGDVKLKEYKQKVLDFAGLMVGNRPRRATQDEIYMHMAFSAAHSSKCVKRGVGAVVVDSKGQVVAVGYNENPIGTKPCVDEPAYSKRCHRDIVRNRHFQNLATQSVHCPVCGTPIAAVEGPPWLCKSCKENGRKTNLESYFFPDRAMNWCTAIHAEVWAIMAAAGRTPDAVLYTTTFPCFQCTEKIIQAGIKAVHFTEAYPDAEGHARLSLAGIQLLQFEGVRSASFERIFAPMKPS